MGLHDESHEPLLARRGESFQIAFQDSLERLLVLPIRMKRRQRFYAVDGESKLNIHGLLGP